MYDTTRPHLAMQSLSCCLDKPLPRWTAPCPIEGANDVTSEHGTLPAEQTWLRYRMDRGAVWFGDNLMLVNTRLEHINDWLTVNDPVANFSSSSVGSAMMY